MTLQLLSLVFMLGGLYAIYANKELLGKPHWWSNMASSASWHAFIGGNTAILWTVMALGSMVKFRPFGEKAWSVTKQDRAQHVAFGSLLFVSFGISLVTGYFKLYGAGAVELPLALLRGSEAMTMDKILIVAKFWSLTLATAFALKVLSGTRILKILKVSRSRAS